MEGLEGTGGAQQALRMRVRVLHNEMERLLAAGELEGEAPRRFRQQEMAVRDLEVELLNLASSPQDFAQVRRIQAVTDGFVARYRQASVAQEQRRRAELLFGGRGPEARGPEAPRNLLGREARALDESIAVVSESVAQAKAAQSSLRRQTQRLRSVGQKTKNAFAYVTRSDRLILKIRRLELRNSAILAAATALLTIATLSYAAHRWL